MTPFEPTCIDLFSGCGGFSLGMQRAGFKVLAAIDFNPEAIAVFKQNFPSVPHALHEDLTQFTPDKLATLIGTKNVDVIVGGPPCQGFSTVRQRDGANSGPRMIEDQRRYLYQELLRYVQFFRPKVFVMENVLGIKSAAGGTYFTRVQREARALGYRVHPQVEKAFELGVPQKRVRQLVIGTRSDLPNYFPGKLKRAPRSMRSPTLGDAIGDLPILRAGGGEEISEYDHNRRAAHLSKRNRRYLYETLEVTKTEKLTAHRARPHSERDLRDFAKLKEGEHCAEAIKRGETFEFPYDRTSFKDRYTRQHREEICSTIVAHLSKDGLMFIHPTQNRSLTPREAARVQSFPDWFQFPVTRTHQFRVIGNAVPPLVGEAVGMAIKSYLEKTMRKNTPIPYFINPLPSDHQVAMDWLSELVRAADSKKLRDVSADRFKKGWYSIGFLYPGLHPDGSMDAGTEISNSPPAGDSGINVRDPRLVAPYHVQSGWPVVLVTVAAEAWRRFDAGELKEEEFYCSEAVVAGMCHRDPTLEDGVREEREKFLFKM